eukprot:SAG11_NODE_4772_length_1770_cov_6.178336_1_plen_120_part_01
MVPRPRGIISITNRPERSASCLLVKMADNMEINDSYSGKTANLDAIASQNRRAANGIVLPDNAHLKFITKRASDVEGTKQLLFHLRCDRSSNSNIAPRWRGRHYFWAELCDWIVHSQRAL